jgi:tRNA (uracil-5-)-methyltransferase TRM9
VDSSIIRQLLHLNHQFYQTFALQFSATRQRLQPGVQRILACLPPGASILDLGCGNGELARALARRGHQGHYAGLDFSPQLLAEARRRVPAGFVAAFLQVDLAEPDWPARLAALGLPANFDAVLAFAVLHHLPGQVLRQRVVGAAAGLLRPGGKFIHSVWQFLRSARWRARLQDWQAIGLAQDQVDPGDYLLDWRQGGSGLRYVHHFTPAELEELAASAGLHVQESFFSDGHEGDLALYQVWNCATI